MTLVTYPGALEYILGPTQVYAGTVYDVRHQEQALHWANLMAAGDENQRGQGFQYGAPALFWREFYRGGPAIFQTAARTTLEYYRDGTGQFPDNAFNPVTIQAYLNDSGATSANNFFTGFQQPSPQMFSAYVLNHPAGEAAATRKCRDIVRLMGGKEFVHQNMKTPFIQWGHGVRETGTCANWNWHAILLGDGNTPVSMPSNGTGPMTPNQMLDRTLDCLMEHDSVRQGWFYDLGGVNPNERYVGNMNLCGTTLEVLCNIDRWKRDALGQIDSRLTHLINRAITWLDTQWVPIGQDEPGGAGNIHYGGAWRYYWYEFGNYGGNGTFPATLYFLGGHLLGPYGYKYLRDGQAKDKQRVFDAMDGQNLELDRQNNSMFDARHYTEYARTFHQGTAWIEIKDGAVIPPPDPPLGTITLTGASTVQGGPNVTTPLTATVTEAQYIACRFTIISGPGITTPSEMDPEIFGTGLAPNPYVFHWNVSPQWTPPGTYQITARARRGSGGGTSSPQPIRGWGASTVGGTGGDVHVTNLNNSGAGSLRNALQAGTGTANRRIVFDVGGTINLSSNIALGFNQLTIDGDTAPTPITLHGGGLLIVDRSEIIIKKLRIRNGPADGISIEGPLVHHIVVDRVSIANCGDGGIDINGGCQFITIQWSLFSQLKQHLFGRTDTLPLETERISYYRNAMIGGLSEAQEFDRFPLVRASGYVPTDMTVDIRNNIMHGWVRANGTKIETGARCNHVNNLYCPSPATTLAQRNGSVQIDVPGDTFSTGNQEVHAAPLANYNVGTKASEWAVPNMDPGDTIDALSAAQSIVANAGVVPRDAIDTELLSRVPVQGTPGTITSAPLTVVVTAEPIPPPTQPVLAVTPAQITLSSQVGTGLVSASLTITNVGTGTLTWQASETTPWLDLNQTSGTAPAVIMVQAQRDGLPAGSHQGAIVITAPGATGSPVTIPVTLTLTGVEPPEPPVQPVLSVSPASMTFVTNGATQPPAQTLTILNTGQTGTLNWTAVASVTNPGGQAQEPGIILSATSGTTPATISVSVDLMHLSANNQITVTAPGAQGSPVVVPVLVTVNLPPIQLVEPKTGWVVAGSLALVALVSQGGV